MLRSRISHVGLVLTIAALGAGVFGAQAGAVSSTPPHIVAKPNNLMINTKTTLTGTGFPANTRLTIEECPETLWIVPQNPCNNTNKISVLTDGHGRFVRQFRAELCGGKRGPFPTSQICYIGEPHPEGIDTIRLLGDAKIIVTYP
jgi:hypothetical protein